MMRRWRATDSNSASDWYQPSPPGTGVPVAGSTEGSRPSTSTVKKTSRGKSAGSRISSASPTRG